MWRNIFLLNLANKAGLQQKDVLEVLELTNISSNLMLEKGNGKKLYKILLQSFLFFRNTILHKYKISTIEKGKKTLLECIFFSYQLQLIKKGSFLESNWKLPSTLTSKPKILILSLREIRRIRYKKYARSSMIFWAFINFDRI